MGIYAADFRQLYEQFQRFLKRYGDDLKAECYIPSTVNTLIQAEAGASQGAALGRCVVWRYVSRGSSAGGTEYWPVWLRGEPIPEGCGDDRASIALLLLRMRSRWMGSLRARSVTAAGIFTIRTA